jgi:hypothetical protein
MERRIQAPTPSTCSLERTAFVMDREMGIVVETIVVVVVVGGGGRVDEIVV